MKLKWKALIAALALAVPALGWAATKGLHPDAPCGAAAACAACGIPRR